MHDMVFENQSDLSIPALLTYAAAVGADPRVVAQELDARTWQEKVRRDLVGGAKSGVNGTPTFFIGGFRYDGQWDYASLLRVLSLIASDS
jgi:protein-disulfide isomerase